jgi:alkyl hydroperoxide reductase subunit AhpC
MEDRHIVTMLAFLVLPLAAALAAVVPQAAHEAPDLRARYDQRNAVIVGVSVDSTDSHKEFCGRESLINPTKHSEEARAALYEQKN